MFLAPMCLCIERSSTVCSSLFVCRHIRPQGPVGIMLRRNVRLRKEYLYKKSLEEKENVVRERKKRVREALESGKPIAPEDRHLEFAKRGKLDLEDETSLKPTSVVIDDEYAFAGVKDPKLLLTTSRDPSSRLLQFVKELTLVFPNSHRVNRGSYVVGDLVRLSQTNEVTDLIVVHEHRGVPDGMVVSHMPLGPTVYFSLQDVVLRHDLPHKPPPMSIIAPHLIFDNFSSSLGSRISSVLKFLFPPAAPLGKRVLTFGNRGDLIHFRHFVWTDERHEAQKKESLEAETQVANTDDAKNHEPETSNRQLVVKKNKQKSLQGIKLKEVGPRFVMKPYRIELGTLDMKDLEIEWALRPYLNKSKQILASS